MDQYHTFTPPTQTKAKELVRDQFPLLTNYCAENFCESPNPVYLDPALKAERHAERVRALRAWARAHKYHFQALLKEACWAFAGYKSERIGSYLQSIPRRQQSGGRAWSAAIEDAAFLQLQANYPDLFAPVWDPYGYAVRPDNLGEEIRWRAILAHGVEFLALDSEGRHGQSLVAKACKHAEQYLRAAMAFPSNVPALPRSGGEMNFYVGSILDRYPEAAEFPDGLESRLESKLRKVYEGMEVQAIRHRHSCGQVSDNYPHAVETRALEVIEEVLRERQIREEEA